MSIKATSSSITLSRVDDGERGTDGASVTTVAIEYGTTTDKTTPPTDDQWQTDVPKWIEGDYIWIRSITTIISADGTITIDKGTPALYQALDDIAKIATDAANEAKKATQYVWHDDEGVHVSETPQAEGFTGANVLLDSGELDFRDKAETVARFGSDGAEIGIRKRGGYISSNGRISGAMTLPKPAYVYDATTPILTGAGIISMTEDYTPTGDDGYHWAAWSLADMAKTVGVTFGETHNSLRVGANNSKNLDDVFMLLTSNIAESYYDLDIEAKSEVGSGYNLSIELTDQTALDGMAEWYLVLGRKDESYKAETVGFGSLYVVYEGISPERTYSNASFGAETYLDNGTTRLGMTPDGFSCRARLAKNVNDTKTSSHLWSYRWKPAEDAISTNNATPVSNKTDPDSNSYSIVTTYSFTTTGTTDAAGERSWTGFSIKDVIENPDNKTKVDTLAQLVGFTAPIRFDCTATDSTGAVADIIITPDPEVMTSTPKQYLSWKSVKAGDTVTISLDAPSTYRPLDDFYIFFALEPGTGQDTEFECKFVPYGTISIQTAYASSSDFVTTASFGDEITLGYVPDDDAPFHYIPEKLLHVNAGGTTDMTLCGVSEDEMPSVATTFEQGFNIVTAEGNEQLGVQVDTGAAPSGASYTSGTHFMSNDFRVQVNESDGTVSEAMRLYQNSSGGSTASFGYGVDDVAYYKLANSFAITTVTLFSSKSFTSKAYADGSVTLAKADWYPLGIIGESVNTRYVTINRKYLESRKVGGATLKWMAENWDTSTHSATANVNVLWARG